MRHVFGLAPGHRTLDVDFGIAVQGWEQFEKLKSALIKQAEFKEDPKKKQRVIHNSPAVTVDLIPFGGVERADRTISWPPEEDIVMRVACFQDAMEAAVRVQLDADFVIPVVSLPLLQILKLFAWVDRKYEKRAAPDISSCYVHFRKPDAEIFWLVFDIVQAPAQQVVYIEYRKHSDVRPDRGRFGNSHYSSHKLQIHA